MVVCFYEFENSKKIALIDDVSSATYADLNSLINDFQSSINGTVGMIVIKNNIDSVACYVASLRNSCTAFLLPGNISIDKLLELVAFYAPDWVWCDFELPGYVAEGRVRKKISSSIWCHDHRSESRILISTSGSTGTKKFVKLTEKNLESNCDAIVEFLPIETNDVAAGFLPLSYSYGLSVLNSHLFVLGTIRLTEKSIVDPTIWKNMKSANCNSFAGVPTMYDFMNRLRISLDGMKYATCAGGALKHDLIRSHLNRSYSFWTMYGQTEATARMSIVPHEHLEKKLGSAGIPIKDGSFEISYDGEVLYRGPNVFVGYCSSIDHLKIDEKISVLSTGDIGKIDEDGFLWITGRKSRFAKIAGLRISLDELQNCSKENFICVSKSDNEITVFIKDDIDHDELVSSLAKASSLPRSCFKLKKIKEFPLNESGKIDYMRLE